MGGNHPVWTMVFFNFEVMDMNHMIEIIVRDKNMMEGQFLGKAEVPMNRFTRPGGVEEFVEIFNMGFASGRVLFKADYIV